jgi:hypothetical protein
MYIHRNLVYCLRVAMYIQTNSEHPPISRNRDCEVPKQSPCRNYRDSRNLDNFQRSRVQNGGLGHGRGFRAFSLIALFGITRLPIWLGVWAVVRLRHKSSNWPVNRGRFWWGFDCRPSILGGVIIGHWWLFSSGKLVGWLVLWFLFLFTPQR